MFNSSLVFLFISLAFRQMLRSTNLGLIVILYLTRTVEAEKYGVYFHIEENAFVLDKNIISNGKAVSLLSCSLMCARRDDCRSANFIETDGKVCLLYSDTITRHSETLLLQKGSVYLKKVRLNSSLPGARKCLVCNYISTLICSGARASASAEHHC